MNALPSWLRALRARAPGEAPGEHVARIVRGVAGCSLDHDADRLAAIFLVNEPDAATARRVSTYATNCGTSMRCIFALAGCDHPLATCAYKVGLAVAWLLTAAREKGAIVAASEWRRAGPGWGAHYGTPGKNDDHVEFILTVPDAEGVALHGGGGRERNAITLAGPNNIRWSSGRPLRALIDPALMLAPTTHALATTRGVQAALASLGYDPGPVDGVAGTRTRAAVRAFQADAGLVADGVVGALTRAALARALALR